MKKIFKFIGKKSAYNIIRYNKEIQNKCEINKDSYNTVFNKIVVEIVPCYSEDKNNIFIDYNINNHIEITYIDSNNVKHDLKRNFIMKDDHIKIIKIKINTNYISINKIFRKCEGIKEITFKKFYRNDITDLSSMFQGNICLKKINFSKFKTDRCNNMSYMFSDCVNLKYLDLRIFNTINVNNMKGMFCNCSKLTIIKHNLINQKNFQ